MEWAGEWVDDDDDDDDDNDDDDDGDGDDSSGSGGGRLSTLPDMEPRNFVAAFKPRNPAFANAVESAKETNPHVSGYLWEPALKLLAHPTFAAEPVAMVIEVQLYLEEFLKYRKAVHCYDKITRAPHLAALAQDCRAYALNPDVAFSRQAVVDFAMARVEAVEALEIELLVEVEMLQSRVDAAHARVVALTH